jgi:hypothetical protein
MNGRDVPKRFRGSVAESKAFEQGEAAGRVGAAPGVNPWLDKGPDVRALVTGFAATDTIHAERGYYTYQSMCGGTHPWGCEKTFAEYAAAGEPVCKLCIRAREAERKRLAVAFEQGRSQSHPK